MKKLLNLFYIKQFYIQDNILKSNIWWFRSLNKNTKFSFEVFYDLQYTSIFTRKLELFRKKLLKL